MSRTDVAAARRNAKVFAGTSVAFVLLLLYPTSTSSTGGHRKVGTAPAPVGVVTAPVLPAVPLAAGKPVVHPPVVVNGAAVDTRYGPVQVQLTLRGRHILRATAIDYPQGGGRDREINSQAIPLLQSETLSAQSAKIDTVSGATYTSNGYRQSLQAALDAAHVA